VPDAYAPPYKPRAKQAEALARLEGQEAFALFMAMRTGKTKVVLDDFGRLELAGLCQDLCVVAPGGVYRTWLGAIAEHLSVDLRRRAKVFLWESGASAAKKRALAAFLADTTAPRILLINVESLSSIKEAREVILAFLKLRRSMLAIDESVIIKNPSSQRTKFINGHVAQHADYRRILSGLPDPKSPLDLYAQFEFLDWRFLGYRSFYAFRARYAVMRQQVFGGRAVPIVTGFRDLEDLRAKMAPHVFRCLLEDCYDLPPKMYSYRDVELTKEQERLYAEMKAFATTKLSSSESYVTATVVIAQILRMHQILCGHVRDEEGNWHEIPENRTAALVDLLSDFDGKAIIWCAYGADIHRVSAKLREAFGGDSVAQFWGGNVNEREAEERRFKTEAACRWMVATASAGGRGREWSVASMVVYYSNTDNLDFRTQSEERTQKVGRADSVLYVDLRAPGTIEGKFISNLRKKIDLSATVHGDGWREWLE